MCGNNALDSYTLFNKESRVIGAINVETGKRDQEQYLRKIEKIILINDSEISSQNKLKIEIKKKQYISDQKRDQKK